MSFDITPGASKEDLVAELSAGCTEYELVGNILWGIQDDIHGKMIACFSLDSTEEGWGYKKFSEREEPFHYSCPLCFLDRTRTLSRAWRQKVRAFHKSQTSTSNDTAALAPAVSSQPLNTANVVPLPVSGGRDLIQRELSRLLDDYDTTSVAAITAEYVEDESGILFDSIKFEFNILCPPLVPPSPELLARTLDAFSRIFARLAELSCGDAHGTGVFHWDLLNDHLENSHTTHVELRAPMRNPKHP